MKRIPIETLIIVGVCLLVIIGVVIGVTTKVHPPTEPVVTETKYIQRRYIDTDAGVVCYLYGQGIDCLPISQTELRR